MDIKVLLDNGAYMPEKAHNVDAGFDIRTPFLIKTLYKFNFM